MLNLTWDKLELFEIFFVVVFVFFILLQIDCKMLFMDVCPDLYDVS